MNTKDKNKKKDNRKKNNTNKIITVKMKNVNQIIKIKSKIMIIVCQKLENFKKDIIMKIFKILIIIL